MIVKRLLIFGLLLTLIPLGGCDLLDENHPSYQQTTIQPLTELEYSNTVNRLLTPLLGNVQTLIIHHLEVVDGKVPIKEEIALTERVIDLTQSIMEQIDKLYQPSSYTEHKAQTITDLNALRDSVKRYLNALTTGNTKKIKTAADGMKDAHTTLKTDFGVMR